VLDLLTRENGSASGKITYKFPNDSDPNTVSRMVDISWCKGIDSDRKRSELNYLLKPEPQHEPGIYFWTVLAYDRDRHVRFAEEMGHFWIIDSVLKDPWKIAINPPVLQKDYDLELTTMIEHEPLQPNVNFELNSSNLTDSAKRNLDLLIEAWDKSGLKNAFIKLGGHTDQTGDSIYNRNLSLKRVNAVKNYLTDMTNIDRDRVFAYGYGEKYLLKDANDFPRARWKQIHKDNRRVEVYLLKEENKDITNQPIDNSLSIKAVSPGNPVTYNLEVINRGYDAADKFTVSITKPNLARLVEGSMSLYLNSSMITSGYDSTVTLDSLSWQFSSHRLGYGDTIKIRYDLVFYSIPGNPYIFVDTAYIKAKYDRKLRNNVAIADTVYVIGEPADGPSMSPISDKTYNVTHIVKKGEYLSLIASKYSKPGSAINWSDIYFYEYIYNDSTNIDRIGCCPDSLKEGTVLVIPDKSIGTKKILRPGVKEAKIVRRPNSKELAGEFSPLADSFSEGKYKFEWLRNNKVVSTETTYTITSVDSGNTLKFKVTPVVADCRCPGIPVFSEPLLIEENPR
jgi:outer membrane protein OmpA-like peptidoglycan-associated protein